MSGQNIEFSYGSASSFGVEGVGLVIAWVCKEQPSVGLGNMDRYGSG